MHRLLKGEMMSADKALVRRLYEQVFNQRKIDALDQLLSPEFIDHNPPPGTSGRLEEVKRNFQEIITGFPDLRMSVEDQIAEGDKIVNRLIARGTHEAPYMGIPPTGKTVEIGGIDILRVLNGKVVERWGYFDDLALLQQLGVITLPG
jgi:steroid delta-isomerase-like uncharacterized protein